MSTPSPRIRDLARALVAASHTSSTDSVVNENLCLSLVRLSGEEALGALLRRALALASVQVPTLQGAKVGADGRIDGLARRFAEDGNTRQEAAVAITAQLLELLVAFIGEPFTNRLVREVCPETPPG